MAKYKNKKVEIDGIVFDSKKEADRWKHLRLLEDAGMIRCLRRQQKFILIPAQYSQTELTKSSKPKCLERECTYIADFSYMDDFGKLHVEDVKGYRRAGAYNIFVIKRKLMLQKYGIRVEEI